MSHHAAVPPVRNLLATYETVKWHIVPLKLFEQAHQTAHSLAQDFELHIDPTQNS